MNDLFAVATPSFSVCSSVHQFFVICEVFLYQIIIRINIRSEELAERRFALCVYLEKHTKEIHAFCIFHSEIFDSDANIITAVQS